MREQTIEQPPEVIREEESITDYVLRLSKNSRIAEAAFNVIDLGASFSELKDFISFMNDGDTEKGFGLLLDLAERAAEIDKNRADEFNTQQSLEQDIVEINRIFKDAGHPHLSPTIGL